MEADAANPSPTLDLFLDFADWLHIQPLSD
jgi:hypothetical protein